MADPKIKEKVREYVKLNLEKIKKEIFADEPPPAGPDAAKLADGTPVLITPKLAEGAVLTKVDEAGKAGEVFPDGDYTLDNGAVLTLAEGKISAIGEGDQMAEVMEVMQAVSEKLTAITEASKKNDEKFTALEAENKSLKEQFEASQKAAKESAEKSEKFNKELFSLIQKIADEPADKPAAKPATFAGARPDPAKSRVQQYVETHLATIANSKN